MFTIHRLPVTSRLLEGNFAGDPHERELVVLTPAGSDASQPMPLIWMLPAHGNSHGSFLSDEPWKEGLPRRLDRLWRTQSLPAVRFALPDLFTRYGGSQMLDSSATGPYESHLWHELKPLVEAQFHTTHHGAAGHSSGGYGALVQAMRHPEILRAAACHAGDMMFEYAYFPDFPKAAGQLRREGGAEKLMRSFDAAEKKFDGRWMSALNVLAMAACYSPNPGEPLGIDLPFDLETCALRDDVWQRWLEKDPLRMVERAEHREALAGLAALYVDVGSRDEWNLQWGARALTRRLGAHGVRHTYEEFDDGHTGTAYRFDRSLPLLARALADLR